MSTVVDQDPACPLPQASPACGGSDPGRPTVTAFVDGVSGHNDRARRATIDLAKALGRRIEAKVGVIGEGASQGRSLGWRAALHQARQELDALAETTEHSLRTATFSAFCLTRNAAALATLPAVARAHPDAAVVWLGAHPCLHTPTTTRTGDLSGMALGAATGLWQSGHGGEFALSNVVLVGARDLDQAEKHIIANSPIRNIPTGPRMQEELAATIAGREVFVHFSADVLQPGIVLTDYQVANGLTIDTVVATARTLAAERVIGLQLSELEHDPTDRFNTSAQLVVEMLSPLLPRP
ncbi:arginase family protein [Leifsonia shinshuensis]|uniref:Arginase n=1 Tax=Leifsonia shinshuensis TaxID=150026 RepID=A0A853D1U7_9MICO|nr:arginase family protein [Leifsonia shinshuensis]NYJ25441.1 arginase [Leifsonia shinshuensis]